MTTISLDAPAAVNLFREIVAEYGPDTLYAERYRSITGNEPPKAGDTPYDSMRCEYRTVDRSQPLCIVGVALDRLGYEVPASLENESANKVIQQVRASGAHISEDARIIFGLAQEIQDGGESWGDALQAVEDRIHRLGYEV